MTAARDDSITVVVDLTPVLPGGDNGGAKLFALELVERLAAAHPTTQFVLLTQAAAHEELAHLDRANVRRIQAVGPAASSWRARIVGMATRALAPMPAWARRRAAQAGYSVLTLLKRGASGGMLAGLRADLLFCPFTAPTFREPAIPTVATVYDLQFRAYPQFFAVEDAAQRERAFEDAIRHATHVAAISDFTRDAARSALPQRSEAIHTVYMRIAGHDAAPGAGGDALLSRLGLAPRDYLCYPANYWKHKNHEMLLAAFALARSTGLPPATRLVLTGAPGERERWLRDAAGRLGLGASVVFAGFLPRHELQALLAQSAGVVFPSLYEGFGLPVLEAMAAGVPVACGNLAALPEAAGGCALLFDPRIPREIAAAMRALVTDEPLRKSLVDAGRARGAEFSDAERMAAEYWELFLRALAPGARAA